MQIPYAKQSINQDDIDQVIETLQSDFLTQGPKVEKFENELSKYVGVKYAVSTNSATSALHISCMALELKKNDTVWTSPISFVASSNCALYCGANIDFVDIDPLTFNLCNKKLKEKLILAKKQNKIPKILIAVHMAGQSCDMETIYQLSKEFKFKVIEDASHAIGGKYKDSLIGSCNYSDITIFSFHPVKIITTAEGGMAVTNNKEVSRKLKLFSSHGITRDDSEMTKEKEGSWYYQQILLGYNYRMNDLQASLGISQLKRIDTFVKKRHLIAQQYFNKLDNLPIILPYLNTNSYSAFHLFIIQLKLDKIKMTHKEVFENLRKSGINVNLHYIPIHLHPYYTELGFKKGAFPNSENYYATAISLPMFPDLKTEEIEYITDKIKNILL